jgi:chemotaxis protein methyltransferase CheR
MEFADRAAFRMMAWKLIRDLINERTGIYFDENGLDLMMDKLSALMSERDIDSPTDYYYFLKYDGEANAEWSNVINAISVRETYFWREMEQIQALVGVLVPRLCATFPEPLRIWSAACASGEEPATIAMALEQEGWFDRHPIEIYASDMSPAALCIAQRGIYRERAFRNLPPELRSRYFRSVSDGWELDPKIRRRIVWRRANILNRLEIEDLARSRVILSRNVFIYFAEATIRNVVRVFEECMPEPGYLLLGAAESLLKFSTKFNLAEIGGAFMYVKGRNS